jgi:O-antigen ligase
MAVFMRFLWDGSFVRKLLFDDFGADASFERGLMGRLFGFLLRPFKGVRKKYLLIEKSSVLLTFNNIFDSILDTPIRVIGAFFACFGLAAALTSLNNISVFFLFSCSFVVLGLGCAVINRSPRELYDGSFVCGLIGRLFVLDKLTNGGMKPPPRYAVIFYAVAGLLFGLLAGLTDLQTFALTAGGLLGFFAVMWRTEIGVLSLAFLLPLVPTTLIIGVCALTLLSFTVKILITRTATVTFRMTDFAVLLYAAVLVYGYFISYDRAGSVFMVSLYLLFVFTCFAVRNVLRTKELIFAAFSLIAASGFLVALYGIYQRITKSYDAASSWIDTTMFAEEGRVFSTLENPNVLGEYLIFVILISFALLYCYRTGIHKTMALGVCGTAVLCIFFTQSRGAWLGLIVAVAVFALLHDRRLILAGIVALFLMPLFMPEAIIERFLSIGDSTDSSTSFRIYIWQASLLLIKDYWVSGIGLGTEAFTRIYRMYAFNSVLAPHSHNLFLQIIIDMGVAGITAFVAVMACFYKNITLALKGAGRMRALSAALLAAMTGYLAQGMTDNVFYNYRIVMFFWFCVALAAALRECMGDCLLSSEKGESR